MKMKSIRGLLAILAVLMIAAPSMARVETDGGPLVFGALANGNLESVREQVTENPALTKAHDKSEQTLLHLACSLGAFPEDKRAALPELVQFLLDKGADPNARDKKGQSPLHRATASSEKGVVEIVAALLAKGADVNLMDDAGWTPLAGAAARGNSNVGKLIRDAGGRDLMSPFIQAIRGGDRGEVLKLLAATPALGKFPDALQGAIAARDVTLAEVLLKNGADANTRDAKTGRTPLFEAVTLGQKTLVELLLKHGADVKITDLGQRSVLDIAQRHRQWDPALLLVKAGAKTGIRYGDRNLILEDAALAGHVGLINVLLDAGEQPGVGNALQKAIARGHDEAARVLIARGAPVEADSDDYWGRSPLQIAALAGNLPMIEFLLQKGATLDATSEQGDSALALATRYSRREIVEYLLNKGADPNASQRTLRPRRDQEIPNESTPPTAFSRALHYALAASNVDLAEILLKKGALYGEPFFDAILGRDVTKVGALLKENVELANAASTQDTARGLRTFPYETVGFVPLYLAALRGDASMTRVLLEAGAKPDAATSGGKTALHFAAASGDVPTVQALLAKGADVKLADKNGANALHFAAAHADSAKAIAISTLLVKSGADIGASGTVLLAPPSDQGAGRGGVVVNTSTPTLSIKTSPLFYAAFLNKVPLVKWLLDNGASLAVEKNAWTPLHAAARGKATETVALLLARGADVNAVAGSRTPLHEAIAPIAEYSPYDDSSFSSEWNTDAGRSERFWAANLAPLQITPQARATVDLLLKSGADPLSLPGAYNATDRLTPLDIASRARDRALTSTLIAAVEDVASPTDTSIWGSAAGSNPLQRAAFFADQNAVELLLARGAKINEEDKSGRTALDEILFPPPYLFNYGQGELLNTWPPNDEAFLSRRLEVAAYLQSKGAHGGSGPLEEAIRSDNIARVKKIIQISPALLKKSGGWRLPLVTALGKLPILEFLIESGADLNARDEQGFTALRHAARSSDLASTRLLLDKGADANLGDWEGRTPLAEVKTNGARGAEVVVLLQARGARDEIGINYRIRAKDTEGVKAMLAADVGYARRVTDNSGNTSLHVAASQGDMETVALLLESGSDIHAINNERNTPLHRAASSRRIELLSLLLDQGADINFDADTKLPPRFGITNDGKRVRSVTGPPLYAAIYGGDKDIVKLLIERGAKVNYRDVGGGTPLQRAELHKRSEIVALLKEGGATD